jgi:hypothetical protein
VIEDFFCMGDVSEIAKWPVGPEGTAAKPGQPERPFEPTCDHFAADGVMGIFDQIRHTPDTYRPTRRGQHGKRAHDI